MEFTTLKDFLQPVLENGLDSMDSMDSMEKAGGLFDDGFSESGFYSSGLIESLCKAAFFFKGSS